MPHYFFNLTNGDSVADEVGEEFDGVEAARGHAMTVARELSRGRLPRVVARPRSMFFRSEITSQYQSPAGPFRETL
jgi:hypothetical protein